MKFEIFQVDPILFMCYYQIGSVLLGIRKEVVVNDNRNEMISEHFNSLQQEATLRLVSTYSDISDPEVTLEDAIDYAEALLLLESGKAVDITKLSKSELAEDTVNQTLVENFGWGLSKSEFQFCR